MHELRLAASRGLFVMVGVLGLLAVGGSGAARAEDSSALLTWTGPNGERVRFGSKGAVESFFENAEVVENEGIDVGVTRPRKLLLARAGVRLHAHFQPVDEVRARARTASGEVELASHDSYKYNLAAYRLGLLLGMDNIPPSFPRSIDRQRGSITPWIEDAFSERDRVALGKQPPNATRWGREVIRMKIFDELIANSDRNQGNILIDPDWKVWLIDHTRAFRQRPHLVDGASIHSCERRLWTALDTLPDERLRAAVEPWLTKAEIRALLARRRLLVARIEELIASRGEVNVLYDLD
jgi:hypothetical protein